MKKIAALLASALMIGAVTHGASAQKAPVEIKVGQTMPFSGPASAYGVIGRIEMAYINMINDRGGVNGRKVKLISLDDAYSPPKTVEQTRRLVEQDEVLAMFGSVGTPTNLAVYKYLNIKKVPHLFVSSGSTAWSNIQEFPWTIGWLPNMESEARIYAKYILKERPQGKIAMLYQNDDSGRDYAKGMRAGLGEENARKMIVAELTYQTTDPTLDSQIVALKASGADVLFVHGVPKFGAQAVRKVGEIDWKPLFLVSTSINTIAGTLQPAGLDKAQGIVSSFILKDPSDPRWTDDPETIEYLEFVKKYGAGLDPKDSWVTYGYIAAQGLVKVLEMCGNDVSTENIMKQARNMDAPLKMLLPGIRAKTNPKSGLPPISSMQLARFEGTNWKLLDQVISADE